MKTTLLSLLLSSLLVVSCQETDIPQPPVSASGNYSSHPKHVEYTKYLMDYQQQTHTPGAVMLVAKPN